MQILFTYSQADQLALQALQALQALHKIATASLYLTRWEPATKEITPTETNTNNA